LSIPLAASAYPVECRSMLDTHRERQSSSLASTLYHACDTHAAEGLAALVDEDIGGPSARCRNSALLGIHGTKTSRPLTSPRATCS
jgi:hypothetical protein